MPTSMWMIYNIVGGYRPDERCVFDTRVCGSDTIPYLAHQTAAMEWYHYVACFFAGAFLANAVPHFVHGVSGDKFPTPFAKPPGKGLSSPLTNALWGLFNFAVGYLLVVAGKVSGGLSLSMGVLFLGAVAISIPLSISFASKDKE
jgi:hypothetical protein